MHKLILSLALICPAYAFSIDQAVFNGAVDIAKNHVPQQIHGPQRMAMAVRAVKNGGVGQAVITYQDAFDKKNTILKVDRARANNLDFGISAPHAETVSEDFYQLMREAFWVKLDLVQCQKLNFQTQTRLVSEWLASGRLRKNLILPIDVDAAARSEVGRDPSLQAIDTIVQTAKVFGCSPTNGGIVTREDLAASLLSHPRMISVKMTFDAGEISKVKILPGIEGWITNDYAAFEKQTQQEAQHAQLHEEYGVVTRWVVDYRATLPSVPCATLSLEQWTETTQKLLVDFEYLVDAVARLEARQNQSVAEQALLQMRLVQIAVLYDRLQAFGAKRPAEQQAVPFAATKTAVDLVTTRLSAASQAHILKVYLTFASDRPASPQAVIPLRKHMVSQQLYETSQFPKPIANIIADYAPQTFAVKDFRGLHAQSGSVLRNLYLEDISGMHIIPYTNGSRSFDLSNNGITTVDVPALWSCKNLRVLDLSNNNISTLSDEFYLFVQSSPTLFRIHFTGNPLTAETKERLRKLWVDGNFIDTAQILSRAYNEIGAPGLDTCVRMRQRIVVDMAMERIFDEQTPVNTPAWVAYAAAQQKRQTKQQARVQTCCTPAVATTSTAAQ